MNTLDTYKVPNTPPSEQNLSDRWELDTTPWIDKIYHELLGETLNPDSGVWEKDEYKQRYMNELGASAFIQEVNSRVSIHMQLSELTDDRIIDISSRAAEIFAERLSDNYEDWGIQPAESTFESICQQLNDLLEIMLLITRKGGMREHREKSKRVFQPNIQADLNNELGGAY